MLPGCYSRRADDKRLPPGAEAQNAEAFPRKKSCGWQCTSHEHRPTENQGLSNGSRKDSRRTMGRPRAEKGETGTQRAALR